MSNPLLHEIPEIPIASPLARQYTNDDNGNQGIRAITTNLHETRDILNNNNEVITVADALRKLSDMFPNWDNVLIDEVFRANCLHYNKTVEALLDMSPPCQEHTQQIKNKNSKHTSQENIGVKSEDYNSLLLSSEEEILERRIQLLHKLFPHWDHHILKDVLYSGGNDLDVTIDGLIQMSLSDSNQQNMQDIWMSLEETHCVKEKGPNRVVNNKNIKYTKTENILCVVTSVVQEEPYKEINRQALKYDADHYNNNRLPEIDTHELHEVAVETNLNDASRIPLDGNIMRTLECEQQQDAVNAEERDRNIIDMSQVQTMMRSCLLAYEEIQKSLQSMSSSSSSQQACIINDGYTSEDRLQMHYISRDVRLTEYYTQFQKVFNEAFTTAAVISSGHLKLDGNRVGNTLGALSTILNGVPFASLVLSSVQLAVDTVHSGSVKGLYKYISALVPASNMVLAGRFSEAISRAFTLVNIQRIRLIEADDNNLSLNPMQERLRGMMALFLDKLVVDGLLTGKYTSTQLLALEHTEKAIKYVVSGSLNSEQNTACIVSDIVQEVAGVKLEDCLLVQPMLTTFPSTASLIERPTSALLPLSSPVKPLKPSSPLPKSRIIIPPTSHISIPSPDKDYPPLKPPKPFSRSSSDSPGISRPSLASSRVSELTFVDTNTSKHEARIKSIEDVLASILQVDTTATGNKLSSAVRTKEGATIRVVNPECEQRIGLTEQQLQCQDEELSNVRELLEELKLKMKKYEAKEKLKNKYLGYFRRL